VVLVVLAISSPFYGQISQSDLRHAHMGWYEHDHAAPLQTLIPARQAGIMPAAHETAQPAQLSRAGIWHVRPNPPAIAPADTRRLQMQTAAMTLAETKRWRMLPPGARAGRRSQGDLGPPDTLGNQDDGALHPASAEAHRYC
jgi:hypothetical protein